MNARPYQRIGINQRYTQCLKTNNQSAQEANPRAKVLSDVLKKRFFIYYAPSPTVNFMLNFIRSEHRSHFYNGPFSIQHKDLPVYFHTDMEDKLEHKNHQDINRHHTFILMLVDNKEKTHKWRQEKSTG